MKSETPFTITASDLDSPMRLDAYAALALEGISRSQFTQNAAGIRLDGKPAKPSAAVKNGQVISFVLHRDSFEGVIPQPMDLEVLYEDDDVLVINKPRGLVVHPGVGNPDGTLVNALAARYGESFIDRFESDGFPFPRPGIVHRLDKETTGLMVIALNESAHWDLAQQFSERETSKLYYAVVQGRLNPPKGELKTLHLRDPNNRKLFMAKSEASYVTLGGHIQVKGVDEMSRIAWSEYQTVKEAADCSLVKVKIHTGRTHQIRVHMKFLGHPIIGDELYNSSKADCPMLLQAYHLEFIHPATKTCMVFEAPMDKEIEAYLASH